MQLNRDLLHALFRCPKCKGSLTPLIDELSCTSCDRDYAVIDGIPDFFMGDLEHDFMEDPNQIWLDPKIVNARDTYYRLCTRELRGMAFCMQEIGRRTCAGCRILEVGMGTGHFTRWLAEVSQPGTEIYSFDFSWHMIHKARENTQDLPGITLFRANARQPLPFQANSFDIILLRLAPLGPHATPNVKAGYDLLAPGGWFFEAGWEKEAYDISPTEWAVRHGFDNGEHHTWQYNRKQTPEEQTARMLEQAKLVSLRDKFTEEAQMKAETELPDKDGCILKMTTENLLIAQKPV
jgi:SAM-dependent methyltransferase